ncbi:MAG: ribulose-phosphate 3-epimerase [Microgenomates bacterium OLB22]|nr:MAG: ribulose-phosphate 3-epimerase [Microgenomates bacterium OLB22]
MIIFPAILSDSLDEVTSLVGLYDSLVGRAHIDLIDDPSLEGKTCSLEQLMSVSVLSLPTSLQLHLMVQDVSLYLEKIGACAMNKDTVLFVPASGIVQLPEDYPYPLGVSISPGDDLRDEHLTAHTIQIMTVYPGKQGNNFLPEQLVKIDELRTMGYAGPVQLDGGIIPETLSVVLEKDVQPDAMCVGRFLKDDPETGLRVLQDLCSQA